MEKGGQKAIFGAKVAKRGLRVLQCNKTSIKTFVFEVRSVSIFRCLGTGNEK